MNPNKGKLNRLVATLLLLIIVSGTFSPLLARKAEAQWVDWANLVPNTMSAISQTLLGTKEFALDTIAWALVNKIIQRMAADTVKWINTGFRGSPAFITNPTSYYSNMGNQLAGEIIFNHPDFQFMCSPFKREVELALSRAYVKPYGNNRCTLSKVIRNYENFMDDFYEGGWDGWIEVTQKNQNNPLGLFGQRQIELNAAISSSNEQKKEELNWGKGFLSFKSCAPGYERAAQTGRTTQQGFTTFDPVTGEEIPLEAPLPLPDVPASCDKYQTNTPGSVIESQLNNTLGAGNERLQVADELNEIITALMNQLFTKAIKGLGSLSSGDGGNNNSVFTDRLLQQSGTIDADGDGFDDRLPQNYDGIEADAQAVNQAQNSQIGTLQQNQINAQTEANRLGQTIDEFEQGNSSIILVNGVSVDCSTLSATDICNSDVQACIDAGKLFPVDTQVCQTP